METIYILGKKGFRKYVSNQFGKKLPLAIPGHVMDQRPDKECIIYWLPESTSPKEVKRAVGAKILFKYRLHFFTSADAYYLHNVSANAELESEADTEKEYPYLF